MPVKIPLDAKLWDPPNFVVVYRGNETLSVPLAAVPDATFHELVEEWVSAIYKKAGKSRPPMPG